MTLSTPSVSAQRKRKRNQVESVHSTSAPSLSMWLQQLDIVERCCVTHSVAEAQLVEADGSRAMEWNVEVEDDRGGADWTEEEAEGGHEDDLSQYIRTEEEITELQQLHTVSRGS